MVMKVKNTHIEKLVTFLMSLELSGKQSRMRTRFCKLLGERLKQIEDERMMLITQYGETDESGELLRTKTDSGEQYHLKDVNAFSKEYSELMEEFFYIDKTLERKEMLLIVKDCVLDCELKFKGLEALEYDEWCEVFEEVEYE